MARDPDQFDHMARGVAFSLPDVRLESEAALTAVAQMLRTVADKARLEEKARVLDIVMHMSNDNGISCEKSNMADDIYRAISGLLQPKRAPKEPT